MISLYTFYGMVEESEKLGERRGQAAFNILYNVRKDLYERALNTNMDPFYTDENWARFVQFIEPNWYK